MSSDGKEVGLTKIIIEKPYFFQYQEILTFLNRGFDDIMHQMHGNRIRKAIRTESGSGVIEIAEEDNCLKVEILVNQGLSEGQIQNYIEEWFDLKRDLQGFASIKNPQIADLVEKYQGLRLVSIPDFFEALCWSIIGQQINLTFAHRLKRLFVEAHGEPLIYENRIYWLFPTPEKIKDLKKQDLLDLKFSRQKSEYVLTVAKVLSDGSLSKEALLQMKNTREMIASLTEIRGIGSWTANYVLMKSLQRMDCIPWGDAGLNQGLKQVLKLTGKPTNEVVMDFFKECPGWESYVTLYVWRSLYGLPT